MVGINIAIECFGITVSILLLFFCFKKNVSIKHMNLFIAMLITNLLVLLCDMFTFIFEARSEYTSLLYIINFFVYGLGYVIIALFTWYLVSYISEKEKISKWIAIIIGILCTSAVSLIVISLFNRTSGLMMECALWGGGTFDWPSQIYPACIIFFDMIVIIRHRIAFGWCNTLSLLVYGILPVIGMFIQFFVCGINLLYIATTLGILILYTIIYSEQGRCLQRREKELMQANLSIMQSQIQPHFLCNSLTAIAYLCDEDPQEAKRSTIAFSQYLRENLESIKQTVPLPFEKELEHIKIYLFLEKMRFQDALNIIYNIQTTDFTVAPLTIQPLVENAVKHGVCRKEGGGTVEISTHEEWDCFIITVKDDGVGLDSYKTNPDGKTHIGVENSKNRLCSICNATLEIESQKNVGTTATVKIPKEVNYEYFSGR